MEDGPVISCCPPRKGIPQSCDIDRDAADASAIKRLARLAERGELRTGSNRF